MLLMDAMAAVLASTASRPDVPMLMATMAAEAVLRAAVLAATLLVV